MKILKLQAENIKRLVAVEITPEGDLVTISGNNGAGKSSVLDAIFWALAGASNIQDKPIREGEEKAFIRLDLGKYTVERRFTQKGTYLDVRTQEGAKFTNAQSVLDDLIGSIAFDPLEFSRMKPADQCDVIKGIVEFEVDLDMLQKYYQDAFDQRRDLNRDIKQLESQIAAIVLPDDLPEGPVDVSQKSLDLVNLRASVDHAERAKSKVTDLEHAVQACAQSLALAQQAFYNKEEELKAAKENLAALEAKKAKPEDVAKIEAEINTASQTNALYQRAASKKELVDKKDGIQSEVDALNEKMASCKKQKEDAFANAKWPVPGLSLKDGAVYFNDIPFDQASSAEQLRISAAIAMASNSELRVMRIKDGSLLDPKGFELLANLAKEHDYQVWVEAVYTNDPMAIIIEDGTVVKVNAEPGENTIEVPEITPERLEKLKQDEFLKGQQWTDEQIQDMGFNTTGIEEGEHNDE